MSDRQWVNITDVTGVVGFSFSIFFNSILLFLIFSNTSPIKGGYKKLLIVFCLFTMFYSAVEMLLDPLIHLYDDTLYLIQRKRFNYSKLVTRLIATSYCWCYAMSFTIFAIQFVYRYVAVCKPHCIDWFSGRYFFYWIVGMCASATSWAASAFYLFPQTERTTKSFHYVITTSYDLDPYWTDYVGYKYFDTDENHVRTVNMLSFLGVIQHLMLMNATFGILAYCGIKTFLAMKKHTNVSEKTRNLQLQLFRALVAQILVPMLLMYIPIGFLFSCPYFDLQLGAVTNYQNVMCQIYPTIDPFILLIVIDSYRKTILEFLCPRFSASKRNISCSTIEGLSTHNKMRPLHKSSIFVVT